MSLTNPTTPTPPVNPLTLPAPPTATRPTFAPTPTQSPLSTLPPPTTALSDSIITNLPRARTAFVNKYSNPELQALPQQIFTSLARFDAQRVARGQNPLSEKQTEGVLRALLTGEEYTKPREKKGVGGVISNTLEDLSGIAQGVIRLPSALISEAQALPTVPGELSQALSTADNPLDAISNVAQVPGIRFLPGAYVAENIEDPMELLRHPVLTALDVAPFGGAAARTTRTFKTAAEAAEAAGRARPRPLPTVMLNKLDNGGDLVPSRMGALINSASATLQATRPGQIVSSAFGSQSRQLARMANEAVEGVKEKLAGQGLDATASAVDDFAREAFQHNQRFSDIDASTRVKLGEIATEDPARIPDLPDHHRAYLESYRRIQDDFAVRVGIDSGELLAATIDGRRQIFDKATGKRVLKAQTQVDEVAKIKSWRDTLLDETLPAETIIDDLTTNRPGNLSLTDSTGKYIGDVRDKMYLSALEVRGYDVSAARELVKNNRAPTPESITPRGTVFDEATDTLRASARSGDKVAAQLTAAITRGDWQTAVSKARTKTISNILGDSTPTYINDLIARREQSRLANQYSRYNDRVLDRVTRQVDRIESRSVPAAYTPLVTKQVREQLARQVDELAIADPNLPRLIESARQLDIGAIPYLSRADLRALQRDTALNWRRMANELGPHQPIFIHKVNPRAASKVSSPQVVPGAPAITQVKARSLDATPYVRDLSVALDHQAVEWLQRQAADEFMATVGSTWGKTFDEIAPKYRDRAVRAAEIRARRTGVSDPNTLVMDELNRLVSREWAPFQHKKFTSSQAADTDLFIPRYLSDNIASLAPTQNKILSNVVDPAMGVFRTSVLALSPRWHVYNLLGGALMLSLEAGPQAFRHVARAYRMVKNSDAGVITDPRTGQRIPRGATQGGFVSVPEDVVRWSKEAALGDKISAAFEFRGAMKARKLFDQARESRLAKLGSTAVQKSYTWNGMVDDMYRTMAYLEGYDKSITRGLSPEVAAARGESLARKILANWDEMTPIERTVMRYWFPFYGFNSFLLRYVSKYPLDHPVRASVLSNIARNELEDNANGLPNEFLSIFQLGGMNAQGDIKALNLGAVNPYRDVADWFRVAGFMVGEGDLSAITSNTNPALSLLLESIGVDTRTGSAELFPDVHVDPETGQLVASSSGSGLIPSALTSFIPQSRALLAMAGWSEEFKAILANNPDAAGRYLASSVGFPIILREFNIPEERIKVEVARQEEQSRARTAALRTGNFNLLREYPNLREYADVLEELEAQGLLDDFKPPAPDTPSIPQAFVQGLT